MKALNCSTTYEQVEAELARELGLSLSLEKLRGFSATYPGQRAFTAKGASFPTIPAASVAADFESRYKACKTASERAAFLRQNKAEARRYLRLNERL